MNRRSCLKASLAVGGAVVAPAGVLALVGCSGTSSAPDLVGFDGKIMGTGYSVRLGVDNKNRFNDKSDTTRLDVARLARQVYAVLDNIDAHMSTWRSESELSRFNNSVDRDWHAITPALSHVISKALDISAASHGAFDVTIGPLVDLWGFGASAANSADLTHAGAPAKRAIHRGLTKVGYDALDLDLDASKVRKLNPAVRLDLSGIAKGLAVDHVVDLLESQGLDSFLVEIGGELRSRGRKPDGTEWRVAIERPTIGQRDVFRVLNLTNRAIATSGDYRNFFTYGGQRYSHSIDPRTGEPVRHDLASVSVAAESTMIADALSTTLMILGPDEAMAFAERHQVAAHLILKSGKKLKERFSQAFETLLT